MQLSPELEKKVCTCTSRFNLSGWGYDESTGYWVHRHAVSVVRKLGGEPCGKPSRFSCVKECEGCDVLFIPEKAEDGKGITVLCPECKEWE